MAEIINQHQDSQALQCSEAVFNCPYNEALIHQVVVSYLAGGRAGTHAQKTRSEVKGGGIKPFRQKGTGRARAGTIRSPLWRTGGKTFAAKPRDYSQKINKKMYKGAMCSIFSELIRQERLNILEKFSIEAAKTKVFLQHLKTLNIVPDGLLIVFDVINDELKRASRNVFQVKLCAVTELTPVELINAKHVILTLPALREIEERFK